HRWSGTASAGFEFDFLGTRMRTDFFSQLTPQPYDRSESPPYPKFDEEYFEWIDLLEAILLAEGRFTMMELGAGFGRWSARAALASEQHGIPYSLVAVEAEPTHFAWLLQNLQDNRVKLDNCHCIQAAVTGQDGKIAFQVGNPRDDYG